jgi:Carbohydrate binding domain
MAGSQSESPARRGRRTWPARLVPVLAALLPFAQACLPVTHAVFTTSTVNPSNAFQAATLQPPTGLSVSSSCPGATVTASWTPTSSTYATGYTLVRKSGGSTQNTINVSGRTSASQDDTNVANGTYTYELNSVAGSWTSSVASASTTVSCSSPTITNPGFESGLTGWTCSGGTSRTVVTSPVHGGSQAVTVVSSSGLAKCQQQLTGLSPNTTYTVHIYMQGNTSGFLFYSTDGSSVSGTTGNSASWVQVNQSFTTGAGVTTMYVGFGIVFSSGTVTFDDMTLTQP